MPGLLHDRVAIVTGAGSCGPGWGNGKASAALFAREGARVFAVDRDGAAVAETRRIIEGEGGTCATRVADVTDSAAIDGLVNDCVERFGRIDVLMNNVGGSAPGGPVAMSEETWNDQFAHNLDHVFLMCKRVLPVMEGQGGGAIVNVSSTSGFRFTGNVQVAYAAAKAGVIQFSRIVAIECARRGIRCNTVVPGQLHTPMVETRLAGQRTSGDVEKLVAERNARIPMGRMGTGWGTARAALFLASDEAGYITGTEIVVDGGLSAKCIAPG